MYERQSGFIELSQIFIRERELRFDVVQLPQDIRSCALKDITQYTLRKDGKKLRYRVTTLYYGSRLLRTFERIEKSNEERITNINMFYIVCDEYTKTIDEKSFLDAICKMNCTPQHKRRLHYPSGINDPQSGTQLHYEVDLFYPPNENGEVDVRSKFELPTWRKSEWFQPASWLEPKSKKSVSYHQVGDLLVDYVPYKPISPISTLIQRVSTYLR
ncbi:MAG: hypothetical protein WCO06_03690 [Candidatus Roizmanbacteria bacterium]